MTSWPWHHPLDPGLPPPLEPPTATVRAVAIVVYGSDGRPVEGARCEIQVAADRWEIAYTNADGYALWPRISRTLPETHLIITAEWYQPLSQHQDLHTGGNEDLPPVLLQPLHLSLPALIADRHVFRLSTGERFSVRECSDFNLLARYIKEGEKVAAEIMAERQELGFNMLRVWTRYYGYGPDAAAFEASIGRLLPSEHPVYDAIPDFMRLAADHGLYVELTAYTGGSREDHWERLGSAVQGRSNALVELINEYDAYSHDIRVNEFQPIPGVLCSHGSAGSQNIPPRPAWGFEVLHLNDASEWWRKPHNAMELSEGAEGLPASHVPAFVNEATRPDHDGNPAHHEDYGACAALLCAGSCFHSSSGKRSARFDALDRSCAEAYIRGAKSVDLSYQHYAYRHGADEIAREQRLGLLRSYRRGDSPFVDVRR